MFCLQNRAECQRSSNRQACQHRKGILDLNYKYQKKLLADGFPPNPDAAPDS
jgi:hypothetical protein